MSLEALNLGVAFDGVWVFQNLSFAVHSADRIALVGPSGSGKSLLLRCLAMLHPIDQGSVRFESGIVSGAAVPPFRGDVMYVPQRNADVDGSVEDFLRIPFSFAVHASKSFCSDVATELLAAFGRSESFLFKTQRELSGGERQIASLVRAIMLEPRILLLDEPTSAMDSTTAGSFEQMLESWIARDALRAYVWVTHDLNQANRVAARSVQMEDLSK